MGISGPFRPQRGPPGPPVRRPRSPQRRLIEGPAEQRQPAAGDPSRARPLTGRHPDDRDPRDPHPHAHKASRVAGRAELFFVVGSSLTVYPAALLPEHAGGQVVVVNQGAVEMASPEWLRVDEAADTFFARIMPGLAP